MKIPFSIFLLAVMLGCYRNDPVLTSVVYCNSRQDYAKTVDEASRRLIGTWKLVRISGGWINPANVTTIPVSDQVVTFDTNRTCVVTKDGQRSSSLAYSLSSTPRTPGYTGSALPELTVIDSSRTTSSPLQLGQAVLFVCDQEMILDYGTPVDATSHTYQRQNR